MRRLIAIVVLGAVAATSVASAAEPCPAMRERRLKHCCCPPSPQGSARLTCCTVSNVDRSTLSARDRQASAQLGPPSEAAVSSFDWRDASLLLGGLPSQVSSIGASATGPPVLALRI
ncbi:MAG TPA: hypothetical protein VFP65_01065 [Anaeromyxobacteraceae bacterium]|nr:hypothetical protein [Anaeromyxobacteraceae bacterium]